MFFSDYKFKNDIYCPEASIFWSFSKFYVKFWKYELLAIFLKVIKLKVFLSRGIGYS